MIALVRPEWAETIAAALFDGNGCGDAHEGGRGRLLRFSCGGGDGLIRKYLRGGIIRHFLKDSYLLRNRARRELRLHVELFENGLPVPEPFGACWERRGLFFKGAIATREINGPNLLDYIESRVAATDLQDALRQCGQLIRQMHDMGVFHADLQIRNILVAPGQAYLIDFDKARRLEKLSPLQRAKNLFRLRRSFEKNGLPVEYFVFICKGYGAESLPTWVGLIYSAKGALSDLLGRRRKPSAADAMEIDPQLLKASKKSVTRRMGNWVVKESAEKGIGAVLRHTFLRDRCRRGWRAALFLREHGVLVPTPLEYIETKRFGFITGNVMISEYLDGFRNVEDYAKELVRKDNEPIPDFFAGLADALNKLEASGAYHSDLSGKNIFTKNGKEFYFIDLDAVELNRPYEESLRLKNHIQLYDSFCDFVDDEWLVPFLSAILPERYNRQDWAQTVRKGQRRRRNEHEGKSGADRGDLKWES